MRLYDEFAEWWPLISTPEDYAEEASFYGDVLTETCAPSAILELGSGGGNNASHLKQLFRMTLVDRSPAMLDVSRRLNPECEHVEGDMRSVRLERMFDAVFVHDAVMYLLSEDDLRDVMTTAFEHCRPGGVALFAPDDVKETFEESTSHGGHDQPPRRARYLQWRWDPDPSDTTYVSDFVYLLSDESGTRCEYDHHVFGLFSRVTWLKLLAEVGFEPRLVPFHHSETYLEVFLGMKPAR